MKSLFTRTYVVLVLLMLIGFLFTLILVDNLLETADGESFRRDAVVEAKLLEIELLQHAPETWRAFVDHYTPVFETAVSILDAEDTAASEFASLVSSHQDTIVTGQSFEAWWLLHPLPAGDLFLLVEEEQLPLTLEDWLMLIAPLMVVMGIAGAALWYIARYIARPIRALATTAQALGSGDLKARADETTSEPIRALAQSFNAMAADLQVLVHDQQVIIGALPHELKTPIARARFALDMTRSLDEVDDLRHQTEKVDGYLMGLESAVEDALALARIQLTDVLQSTSFDLTAMIATLCDLQQIDTHMSIDWSCAVADPVVGDEALLRLAIGNIINNGLNYGSTKVRIQCFNKPDGTIVVAVDDDGPGIPETHRESIFAPFYRLDDSRSRATGGVGLGLAMVSVIARRVGGRVSVLTNDWGGARFEFSWPRPKPLSPTP